MRAGAAKTLLQHPRWRTLWIQLHGCSIIQHRKAIMLSLACSVETFHVDANPDHAIPFRCWDHSGIPVSGRHLLWWCHCNHSSLNSGQQCEPHSVFYVLLHGRMVSPFKVISTGSVCRRPMSVPELLCVMNPILIASCLERRFVLFFTLNL